jgi:hypothetical protein
VNFNHDYESESMPYQILAVDDEPHVINAYKRSLGDAHAGSGELSKLESDLFGYIQIHIRRVRLSWINAESR